MGCQKGAPRLVAGEERGLACLLTDVTSAAGGGPLRLHPSFWQEVNSIQPSLPSLFTQCALSTSKQFTYLDVFANEILHIAASCFLAWAAVYTTIMFCDFLFCLNSTVNLGPSAFPGQTLLSTTEAMRGVAGRGAG